jgi:Dyp-type peroxidase family
MARDLMAEPQLAVNEIQGDIIIGLLKRHEHLIFFQINDKTKFIAFLKGLEITSAQECLDKRAQIAANKARHDGSAIPTPGLNLAFTFHGMQVLDVPGLGAATGMKAFREGMAASQAALADPPVASWKILRPGHDIHGVFIVTGASHTEVVDIISLRLAPAEANGWRLRHEEVGEVRPDALRGHEHFGYADGVSQPGIRGTVAPNVPLTPSTGSDENQGVPGQDLLWPGEFVFGYPGQNPTGPDFETKGDVEQPPIPFMLNGAFLVFRRLAQLVPEFEASVKQVAASIAGDFDKADADLLGAQLVGRWKSGAPLILASKEDDPNFADGTRSANAFEFGDDRHGLKCPWAAHIRKAHPRNDVRHNPDVTDPAEIDAAKAFSQTHRMLRRSITFGPELTEEEALKQKSAGGLFSRGLLFKCYCTSIEDQFEFVQQAWINNADFSQPNSGIDPIIGRRNSEAPFLGAAPFSCTASKKPQLSFPRFVNHEGGAYFFSPSITALKAFFSNISERLPLRSGGEDIEGADPLKYLAIRFDEIDEQRTLGQHEGLLPDRTYRLLVDLGDAPDVLRRGGGGEIAKPATGVVVLQVAAVSRRGSPVRFSHGLAELTWNADGSTTSAVLAFDTLSVGQAAFDVFVHHDCDLLLAATVEVEIAPAGSGWSRPDPIGWRDATRETPERRSRPFRRFLRANTDGCRAACIAVQAGETPDEVLLTFLASGAELPVRLAASRAELESHLLRVRGLLDRLRRDPLLLDGGFDDSGHYTGDYGADSPCHRSDGSLLSPGRVASALTGYMRDLALAGIALRSALFRDAEHQIAFRALQRWTALPGSVLQVWLDRDVLGFTVPWAWLYDGALDPAWRDDGIKPSLFWGHRLVVEQVGECVDPRLPRPSPEIAVGEAGLRIRVGTYGFAETAGHVAFIRDLAARCRPPLDVKIWNEDGPWETLLRRCDAHLLYFFAHGHTALPKTAADERLVKIAEALKAFQLTQADTEASADVIEALQRLHQAMAEVQRTGMWDEHHIRLGDGHLKMEDLRSLALSDGVAPLVVLNMCESAQLFPSLTDGLVHVFLRNGSLGVVGTEMPMLPRFADLFGRLLLTRLVHGEQVGPALLSLRRRFLEVRNPLGFAYTHYGDALARVVPPLINQD